MITLNAIPLAAEESLLDPTALTSPPVLDAIAQSQSIPGTDASETVTGTPGDDAIFTEAGDDTIVGTQGNDFVNGGLGFDTLDFSDFAEAVTLRPSGFFDSSAEVQVFDVERVIAPVGLDNTIDGSELPLFGGGIEVDLSNNSFSVDGVIVPNPGLTRELSFGPIALEVENFSAVIGSRGADSIIGDDGDNVLRGGPGRGDDTIRGLGGDDEIEGGGGSDRIVGGRGSDTISGGNGGDFLRGNAGVDIITGGGGRDRIFGGAGTDFLNGGASNDIIRGGTGNDEITGGAGDDLLSGESGRDTFLFTADSGTDTILDFNPDEDFIGFGVRDPLQFDIDFIQSGSSTLVTEIATGDVLAELVNVNASDLSSDIFTVVPFVL